MTDSSLQAQLDAADLDWIVPDWPVPAHVHALSTTRNGVRGSAADFSKHSVDAASVHNTLRRFCYSEPVWLAQVHGTTVCDADGLRNDVPTADAAISRSAGKACAILAADCLPVLFSDRSGNAVGAAHAGWRGLAAGVLEATVDAMRIDPSNMLVWLGPAIGPRSFQVGRDVFESFCGDDPGAAECFVSERDGKWRADLYGLARRRLARVGVSAIFGGGRCTYTERNVFYSYRRGGEEASARMATLIWIEPREMRQA
ncbi:MAG: peptidoglycan editing factor PgeF [Betaproteobacteria bacterium]|nr:MAG: peptidoglycan editing factor PgeF [Betaproteobacteria bacterium]